MHVGPSVTAFGEAFGDIVSNEKFFFQLESDKWGGRFVDLREEDALVDNSVVKAVPLQVRLGIQHYYIFCELTISDQVAS